jgi:polysaccharide deacetylase 2 family uncharacterized protein YibQ
MKRSRRYAGFAFIAIMCLAALLFYTSDYLRDKDERHKKETSGKVLDRYKHERAKTGASPSKDEVSPTAKRKIAILIDDIGYDLASLDAFLTIDAPLSFAVLPHCRYSVAAAKRLHHAGREILLHLPMEPHNYPYVNPGHDALFMDMNEQQIMTQVEKNINAVPYITGVSNHMGSRFMEDEAKLSIVFTQLKQKNLFFVDSKTTGYSRGPELAKKLGLRFLSRKVFLDSDRDSVKTFYHVTKYLNSESLPATDSWLLIGHPYPRTIDALKKALPVLKAEGIEIVPVSDLL